jgi:hypothetical protein
VAQEVETTNPDLMTLQISLLSRKKSSQISQEVKDPNKVALIPGSPVRMVRLVLAKSPSSRNRLTARGTVGSFDTQAVPADSDRPIFLNV